MLPCHVFNSGAATSSINSRTFFISLFMPKHGIYQRISPGFASLSRPSLPYICPTNLCLSRISLVEDCCCSARKTLFTHDGPDVYFRRGRRLTRSYVKRLRDAKFEELTEQMREDFNELSKVYELIKYLDSAPSDSDEEHPVE